MTDHPLPNKNDFVLQPLHDDVSVAATPISSKTQSQLFELEELRKQIDNLTNNPAVTDTVDTTHSLGQQINQQQDLKTEASIPKQKKAAVQVVRDKLAKLYAREPDATDEAIKAFQVQNHRSKHQMFMYNLTTSGKSLAQIQTQWHEYYVALPDSEKHVVWQEFYKANEHNSTSVHAPYVPPHAKAHSKHTTFHSNNNDTRTTAQIKQQVVNRLSANGKLKAKHHFQSLLFGMVMASIVVVIFLFGFFNERFIAPFVSPSKQVSATPIVGSSVNVGPESKIIIPKINLEVPVVYDLNTTEEKDVQAGLENGVVHYSTSVEPGQVGNVVIVGHSSNNILNKGKYKFAFVLLKRLEIGDTISLQKGGIRYTYEVYDKKIVKPTDVSVLGTTAKPNTVTLITCDPPGTSLNRLVVVAEQISPDPTINKQTAEKVPALSSNGVLPSNAPSLWQRIKDLF
ncbi:class D sortase [bacterium]|nr:class D sortase [bacterium]NBX97935.1 class D sortase [bacterium]NDC94637.1 class D sortase [bacterium]NDD83772.1 class D sortase [bacterium]NDG28821.1 class D sortase [bacterium]